MTTRLARLPLVWGCSAAAALAQAPAPDPHWGASMFPALEPELRASVSLNRFTEFDSSRVRFNDVQETSGFNTLHLSLSESFPFDPDLYYRFHGGVGLTRDQPTRFLQNDFIHELLGLRPVPVDAERDQTEYVAAFAIDRWFEGPRLAGDRTDAEDHGVDTGLFLGGGISTGTLYHEAYAEIGGTLLFHDTFLNHRRIRVQLMHRITLPDGGEAYPDVAHLTNITQLAVSVVPKRVRSSNWVWSFLGNPEVGLVLTHDTGLFVDPADHPIPIWFGGLRVRWATGLSFETWNDMFNGSDHGPSYGLQLGFDLMTLFKNPGVKW